MFYRNGYEVADSAKKKRNSKQPSLTTYGTFGPVLGLVRDAIAVAGDINLEPLGARPVRTSCHLSLCRSRTQIALPGLGLLPARRRRTRRFSKAVRVSRADHH